MEEETCCICGEPLENGWCINSSCEHSGLVYDEREEE